MLIGNKSDLRHLVAVSTEDGKGRAERESLYFMETSALESTDVGAGVVTQIHQIASKKTLEAGDDAASAFPSKGERIEVKDDVSALKRSGCCSRWVKVMLCDVCFVYFVHVMDFMQPCGFWTTMLWD
ncbi:hypothetical protein COCNU_06G003700 [Cocos nucifera]|uniref:Uncharacterized protein n=1 Tax=Cocos nucifera TaxID=13894 RepID=A0A8K0IA59_COCNU|nr:hypothetical protein COCNU_06G003700 [Cocos nucifera]